VDTPPETARQRLLANRINKTRVDFSDEEFEELAQLTEPPGEDEHALIFHDGDQLDTWITQHLGERR
jgi:hypothetical protein